MNIIIIASGVDWDNGEIGISGGDRIFLELSRRLSRDNNVVIYGWEATALLCKNHNSLHLFRSIGNINAIIYNNRVLSYLARTIKTTIVLFKDIGDYDRNKTVIISASDFWPDSIPAYIVSFFCKYKWAASFFLVAPSVLLVHGSHKGIKRVLSLFYKFSQYISIKIIKKVCLTEK